MSDYKRYACTTCGTEYDEAKGWPEEGIPPGTRFSDLPDDWICPMCGTDKRFYEEIFD